MSSSSGFYPAGARSPHSSWDNPKCPQTWPPVPCWGTLFYRVIIRLCSDLYNTRRRWFVLPRIKAAAFRELAKGLLWLFLSLSFEIPHT